jgi:hypothetical protein
VPAVCVLPRRCTCALCCAVLCCAVLCCALDVLCCAVLGCAVLCCSSHVQHMPASWQCALCRMRSAVGGRSSIPEFKDCLLLRLLCVPECVPQALWPSVRCRCCLPSTCPTSTKMTLLQQHHQTTPDMTVSGSRIKSSKGCWASVVQLGHGADGATNPNVAAAAAAAAGVSWVAQLRTAHMQVNWSFSRKCAFAPAHHLHALHLTNLQLLLLLLQQLSRCCLAPIPCCCPCCCCRHCRPGW